MYKNVDLKSDVILIIKEISIPLLPLITITVMTQLAKKPMGSSTSSTVQTKAVPYHQREPVMTLTSPSSALVMIEELEVWVLCVVQNANGMDTGATQRPLARPDAAQKRLVSWTGDFAETH